ncbi:MAG: FkbM family methyltransferase, partial [Chitinophagaceae bacterium]|nr:FkbM family methyltransferase [Chitinophagaceae bacterium]
MQQLVKKALKRGLHPWITKLGYEPRQLKIEDNMLEEFFITLAQTNFKPLHIVDVGANHGKWTRTAFKYFPEAYFTLLEPQKWLEVHVKDLLQNNPRIKFHAVGAGSENGSFKFTLLDRDDSSTFMITEEQASEKGLKQIDIEVVALNDFIPQQSWPGPAIIKLDAEGIDLEVLKGASDYFGKTEILLVEATVVSKHSKNDVVTVINYMKEN